MSVSGSSSVYERQVAWLEAREKNALSTSATLRSKDDTDNTFHPKLFSKSARGMCAVTPREPKRSPQKKCGLVAHDLHVRRYAKARADKERQTAAMTRSTFHEHNYEVFAVVHALA